MANINQVFAALADKTRRHILKLLQRSDMTPGELIKEFTITQPSLTHHLNVLKQADLVIPERKGQNIVYSLNVSVFEEVAAVMFEFFDKKTKED